MSLLEKMRGDKRGWYKVSDLRPGVEIATPAEDGGVAWDEIVSITPVGREQVYDIEVEGTHNFVGNGIFAHNTYVLRANTMLAVTGEVNAEALTVPAPIASSTLMAEIPSAVLTADGLGVDLYKLATYNLAVSAALAARVDAEEVRITSLEDRVTKLETGAIASASGSPLVIGTSSLASALASFGTYIQNGIAQFGTLVADRFVAATNSAGTSSAGTVTILAGNTIAQVTNAYVLPTSKIFVTLTASTTGSWYVSDKQAGSFKITLSEPQSVDVSFDYFIVQTEGQIATSTPDGIQGSTLNPNPQGRTLNTGATITLLGDNPVHVSVGGIFADPGVVVAGGAPVTTFINGVQQEVSPTTIDTASPTTYIITYQSTDASGALVSTTRAVIVGNPDGTVSISGQQAGTGGSSSNTPPTTALVGAAAMQINVGDTFTDPGATAVDSAGADLTAGIVETGKVDTATAGLYTLTYTATDTVGQSASVSRVVTVAALPAAASAAATASSTPASQ